MTSVRSWLLAAATLALVSAGLTGTAPTAGAPPESCVTDPAAPKRQLRADWIASVVNIDWPSRPGLTPAQQKAELEGWYDEAVDRGLNAVIVQVRPTADAFWPSPLEPWSKYLTGTQGRTPATTRWPSPSRRRTSATWSSTRGSTRTASRWTPTATRSSPTHPARVHPDWVFAYGGKLYYDPGIPAVRELVEDAIMDAVERYDIDGVHFDDYFYPYPVAGQPVPDDATFAQYPDGFTDKADWRRHNIDLLISELRPEIHAAKPWVKFGVSPFAVWRNIATDPEGSDTTAGAQTYDDLYADTRKWVREEWIDYIVPQVYWASVSPRPTTPSSCPGGATRSRGTDVQLYIGQATYKVGTVHPVARLDHDPSEMTEHLFFNRDYPEVDGDIYFSAKDVRANRLGHMDIVRGGPLRAPGADPGHGGRPRPSAARACPAPGPARRRRRGADLARRREVVRRLPLRRRGRRGRPVRPRGRQPPGGHHPREDLDRHHGRARYRVHVRRHRAGPRVPGERAQPAGVGSRGLAACCTNGP